ncbi:MAG: hypothetical protein ABIJ96_13550 [Elusimicrobiota bacterium]
MKDKTLCSGLFALSLALLYAGTAGAVACGGGPPPGVGTGPRKAVTPGDTQPLPEEEPYETVEQRQEQIRRKEDWVKRRPDDLAAQKELGIHYHHLAYKHRVKGAAHKAFKQLSKLREQSPADAELDAWTGSARTLVARDSINPIKKLRWAKKGFRLIDAAVKRSSNSVVIRNIRANNSLHVPRFLKRESLAKGDLLHMETLFGRSDAKWWSSEKHDENDKKNVMAEAFFKLAGIFQKENNALQAASYLKKAAGILSSSPWSILAKRRLAEAPPKK